MTALKRCGVRTSYVRNRAFIPIDELLGYMIDQHFADADKRRELHAAVREARKQRAELNKDYEVAVGRMGALYLTCKNSECGAESKTQQQAREGQMIVCKPIAVTCPFCANTYAYDGQDLKLKLITMN